MPSGFDVPFALQTLSTFTDDGDLERLVHQLVALLPVDASLQVDRIDASGVRFCWRVAGEDGAVRLDGEAWAEEAMRALFPLFVALNETLSRARDGHRVVVVRGGRFAYTVQCLTGAALDEAVEGSWEAAACVDGVLEPAAGDDGSAPPALNRWHDIVPAPRVFDGPTGLAEMIARVGTQLARFAGLDQVVCEATTSRSPRFDGPGTVAIRVVERSWGTSEQTVMVPVAPRTDLQPLVDVLNALLDAHDSPQRLHRVRAMPHDRLVLVSAAEVERLQRAGVWMAPRGRRALELVADAGARLPAMADPPSPDQVVTGLPALAALLGEAGATLTWDRSGAGLTLSMNGREVVTSSTQEPMPWASLLSALNACIPTEARLLALRGEPVWSGIRVVLVDPPWATTLAPLALPGCLEPGWVPCDRPALRASAPPVAVDPPGRKVPTLRDLVGARRLHPSDFKCASRASDLPGVVEEIGAFAGMAVEVHGLAEPADPQRLSYRMRVTAEGDTGDIVVGHHKYVDVRPILAFLNARRAGPTRLYAYRGPGYDSGVLLATEAEAERLKALGYVPG